MSKHFIIGDVHGMAEELDALLTKLGPTAEDTVVFVGDLVDKGPDSIGAVQLADMSRRWAFSPWFSSWSR